MTAQKYALAMDLGGTNLRGAIVDGDGKILLRRETKSPEDREKGFDINLMVELGRELMAEAAKSNYPLTGLGLALPGFLLAKASRIHFSPNLIHLGGIDVGKELSKKLAIPCMIENDGNCAALGEWWVGHAKGHSNAVVLMLGTGLGGGIICDNRLIRGNHGSAGEVGHICIDSDGPSCGCGSNGCLEAFVSGTAFKRDTGMTSGELFQKAEDGDSGAIEAFKKMGHHLGVGLTTFCFLFDPEVVALGGKVSRAHKFFLPAVTEELEKRLANHPSHSVKLIPSGQGDDVGLLGAAWLCFDRV